MQHPTADPYQPPLTLWSHAWRLLAMLAISATVWSPSWSPQWQQQRTLFWVDLGLGVVAYAVVLYRRRHPLAVPVVLTVMCSLSAVAVGPGLLAGVSLATRRRLGPIVVVALLSIAGGVVYTAVEPSTTEDPLWLVLAVNVLITVAAMAIGMYFGSRRELLWTLRDRAERAEAEQGLRVRQARSNERARIAREMHDVLAHRISLVSMHAGALAYREDLAGTEAAQSARIIQENAHEALEDLRNVLGVLRDDDDTGDRPQPTFADLPALVEQTVASGTRVEYTAEVTAAASMSEQVGRTVYRMVQEALTNARKHAPGAAVRVLVAGSPADGVDVMVRNLSPIGRSLDEPAPPGSGLGLVGLAERAELLGGRLSHGGDRESFTLHGWLPWAP